MKQFIHIGYPKTATTWFQKNFFPFVQNADYIQRHIIVEKFINVNALDFDPLNTRKYFNNSYNKNIIMSLEGFIGTNHNFGLKGYLTKEHATRLKEVFPNAQIIIFLRNQYDIISSSYYQYIRGGGNYNIANYLFHKPYKGLNSINLFSYDYFKYDKVLDLYKKLFNDKNLHIFLYEEFKEDNLKFIEFFSKKFGFEIDIGKIKYKYEKEKFRKYIKTITMIANCFTKLKMTNKYYIIDIPGWHKFSRKIINTLNKYRLFGDYPTSYHILGKRIYNYIHEYYKESNQRLIRQYNLFKIKDYNYPL